MEKAKILIIEEELIVREDLSISLREEGYEVVAAVTSVDEALAITEIDAVVCSSVFNLRLMCIFFLTTLWAFEYS